MPKSGVFTKGVDIAQHATPEFLSAVFVLVAETSHGCLKTIRMQFAGIAKRISLVLVAEKQIMRSAKLRLMGLSAKSVRRIFRSPERADYAVNCPYILRE